MLKKTIKCDLCDYPFELEMLNIQFCRDCYESLVGWWKEEMEADFDGNK